MKFRNPIKTDPLARQMRIILCRGHVILLFAGTINVFIYYYYYIIIRRYNIRQSQNGEIIDWNKTVTRTR